MPAQAAGEGREMNARALHVRNPTSIGIEAGPRTDGDAAIGHDEWLVDEAILGSFPASDPASSAQPGSIVNERYADASLEERD
jgi:hypothetical protein